MILNQTTPLPSKNIWGGLNIFFKPNLQIPPLSHDSILMMGRGGSFWNKYLQTNHKN